MKFTLYLSTLVLPLLASATAGSDVFRPARISYEQLLLSANEEDESAKKTFMDALTTTGLISITDIPNMEYKDVAFSALHECAKTSKAAEMQTFLDGTQRRTIATHFLPNFMGTVDHEIDNEACEAFNEASASFRPTVTTVTQAFADRIVEMFLGDVAMEDDMGRWKVILPLLSTPTGDNFVTIADVVREGEHLEHFRSYEKLEQKAEKEETIDLHIDQGLFLVFSPGRTYYQEGNEDKTELSSGFFIIDQNDNLVEVTFDEEDDLVIMIGDGFNQYVNHRLTKKLRPVPHSLTLSPLGETGTRAWYGRMVLPPVDAVHPTHGITFGELREQMIHSSNEEQFQLGCSGGRIVRNLGSEATTCEGDSIQCWHGCMNAADFGVSTEECTSLGLELLCINPRLQISEGIEMGDYYPACADPDGEKVTPFPTLPNYPRSSEECTEESFQAYVNVTEYEHAYELHPNATFLYTLEDDAIKGRLVFNGLFGWISFGFANVGGGLNGMLGGTVIMGVPGGNYTAFSGLDLSLGPSVEEYVMDLEDTAFRHWQTPVTGTAISKRKLDDGIGPATYEVDETECFTSLMFKTSSIYNVSFNLDGTDELLWGADGDSYYVTYHEGRGRFAIDWPTGKASGAAKKLGEDEDASTAYRTTHAGFVLSSMIMVAALMADFLG